MWAPGAHPVIKYTDARANAGSPNRCGRSDWNMCSRRTLFVAGRDYHLGDLLWLLPVVEEYRRHREPCRVEISVPDRDVSRILEHHPAIEEILYRARGQAVELDGFSDVVDLRPLSLARGMLLDFRRRLPWLYYRDLWMEPRGQWLATYLGLGGLASHRPSLRLVDQDREAARAIGRPFVVLAPHTGSYRLGITQTFWRHVKGWENQKWQELAGRLRAMGLGVVSMGAEGQAAVPDTLPAVGLPIRQAAGIVEAAEALVTGESGLWLVAAALGTPFVIVPWWLPRLVDWAGPMDVRYALVRRRQATVDAVLQAMRRLCVASSPANR